MNLTEEQIAQNWASLLQRIEDNFDGQRKDSLLRLYNDFAEKMMMAPASGIEHFHNCFIGGYVDHVLRVMSCAERLYSQWEEMGADMSNYTHEELMFCALNHDLGKVGDKDNDYYVPNPSEWHRKNQGKIYSHNPSLQYMKVPDRALWLLQHFGVKVTDKEYIGIKLTDGLFDEANKSYLMTYNPDFALQSNMPHILHQADMMATYIEGDLWKRNNNENENHSQLTKVPKTKDEQEQVDNLKQKFDELFA